MTGFTRRRAAALAGGPGAAVLLAACGERAPRGAGAALPAGAHASPVRLEMLVASSPGQPHQEAYTAALETLVQPAPSVELTLVPGAELLTKATAAVTAGTPPALAELPPGAMRQWHANGVLAPLDDLFKRDGLSKDDFPAAMWTVMSHADRVWFLPGVEANADFVLFWNKQHLREAGLDPNRGPSTIAELDEMALKLGRERAGEIERLAMKPWDVYGPGNSLQGWGYAMGGRFQDERTGEPSFEHPRVRRAVEWMAGWAQRLGFERVAAFQQSATVPGVPFFGSSRLGIAPLVSVNLRDVLRHDPQIEIGAGPMPGEPPGRPGAVAMGGWVAALLSGAPHREHAWRALKHVGVSDAGTLAIARRGGVPGYLRSPGLAELSRDPLFKQYVEGVRRAEFPQIGFYAPGGYDAGPIQQALEGKRGVADALEEVTRDARQRHARWLAQTAR